MKIVLEVKGSENPKNDDILVYDKELECWKICSKNEFLKDIRKEFKDLKEEFILYLVIMILQLVKLCTKNFLMLLKSHGQLS